MNIVILGGGFQQELYLKESFNNDNHNAICFNLQPGLHTGEWLGQLHRRLVTEYVSSDSVDVVILNEVHLIAYEEPWQYRVLNRLLDLLPKTRFVVLNNSVYRSTPRKSDYFEERKRLYELVSTLALERNAKSRVALIESPYNTQGRTDCDEFAEFGKPMRSLIDYALSLPSLSLLTVTAP